MMFWLIKRKMGRFQDIRFRWMWEEFDEQLFKMTAEKIVVSKEHDITFCLHNGLKLTERGGGQDAVAHANRL